MGLPGGAPWSLLWAPVPQSGGAEVIRGRAAVPETPRGWRNTAARLAPAGWRAVRRDSRPGPCPSCFWALSLVNWRFWPPCAVAS